MSHGVDPFPNDTPRTIRIAGKFELGSSIGARGRLPSRPPIGDDRQDLREGHEPSAYSNARASAAAYINARTSVPHTKA